MEKLTLIFAAICGLSVVSPVYGQECYQPYDLIGGKCIIVDTRKAGSFFDMRLYCKTLETEGELVRIKDADQLHAIIEHINEQGLNRANYWIDATDGDSENHWYYGDGTPVPRGAPFWRYDCDELYTQRPLLDAQSNCAILDHESHYLLADTSCLGDIGELNYNPICEQVEL